MENDYYPCYMCGYEWNNYVKHYDSHCAKCGKLLQPAWKLSQPPLLKLIQHQCSECKRIYYSGVPAGLCPVCRDPDPCDYSYGNMMGERDDGRVRVFRCASISKHDGYPERHGITRWGFYVVTDSPNICPFCKDDIINVTSFIAENWDK